MSKEVINIGSAPDAMDGDDMRTGGIKCNDNFTELYDRLVTVTADLVAGTDYPIPNPYTLPVIPIFTAVYTEDGVKILDAYEAIDQSTGDVTIMTGANFNNAKIVISW